MKRSLLLPFLRSQTQGDLLALLFLNPEREFTIAEVARQIGVSAPGVHHEVTRLYEAGLIADRRDGQSRKIRALQTSVVAKPLFDLLAVTYGPLPVLTKELAHIKGMDRAYIYGSWAARYSGRTGKVPNDIDVLIVGSADLDELDAAALRARSVLLREVDIQRVSTSDWQKAVSKSKDASPFLVTLLANPLIEIHTSLEKSEQYEKVTG